MSGAAVHRPVGVFNRPLYALAAFLPARGRPPTPARVRRKPTRSLLKQCYRHTVPTSNAHLVHL
eukprot:6549140-Pyramimonas_sp.AAC.1